MIWLDLFLLFCGFYPNQKLLSDSNNFKHCFFVLVKIHEKDTTVI